MKLKAITLIVVALLLAAATPVYAADIPPLPHAFYGDLTINGSPAPAETIVEARGEGVRMDISGNPIETTEVGKYGSADPLGAKLVVQGDIAEGETLTFYVDGVLANETADWHSGEVSSLDLTAAPAPEVTYELTMAVVGQGTVTPGSGTYAEGDMTITATAASGWEFSSWSTADMAEIANASSAATTLTLDKDKTVTATFTEIGVLAVTTNAATSIGTTTATLNGRLTGLGNASSVEVSFEWGTSTSYGNETATQTRGTTGSFSAALSGLSSSTTYHFRAKAVGEGTSYGGDKTFTTTTPAPAPPTYYYIQTNLFGVEKSYLISYNGELQETIEATSEDGMLTLTIPEGTVTLDKDGNRLETLEAAVDETSPDPPEDAHIIGLAYDFTPDGATFDPAITFPWSYDPDALPEDVAEEDLFIAYYDEDVGEWVEVDGVVDTVNNTITASVAHFTTFAIIGTVTPPTLPAPAAFSVSSLSVLPAEVEPGETVTIAVLVANTGGEAGSYQVTLVINDLVEATKEVIVRAGLSKEVTFSVTREEAGSYTVTVDGLSGSFSVAPVVVLPEPAAFSVSYLSVRPRLEVEPGETVAITVLVANTGGESGSYTVVLKIDGAKEDEETVTIAAGESQDVSFSVTREEADSYAVTVDGLSGSFTVVLPVEPPGVNWPLIGGIIGGVVIVAGLLYYFLVFRRRAY